jgi:tight adherence protein C
MILLFAIGTMLLGVAAALAIRALTLSRVRMAAHVQKIEAYGFTSTEPTAEEHRRSARLLGRLSTLAERIGRSTRWTGWRAPPTTQQLRGAGLYTITPDVFQGYRVMLTGGLTTLILLDVVAGSLSFNTVLLLLVSVALAWFGPFQLVRSRAQRRMDKLDGALPELIDLLIATIEAGLGFAGSLQLVADRFDGPLGQELRLTLREQNMGLSTDRALGNLLERCETPSMRAFVRAVSQGESLGVSIGAMMRNLATDTRKRRRQLANEKVQKAPVKMLFPLVLMVFPALLIVLLYPAGHDLIQQLSGH